MDLDSSPQLLHRLEYERLAHNHDQFVGRQDEIEKVLKKTEELAEGKAVERRVITFSGEAGLGKTWLLKEIKHRLQTSKNSNKLLLHWFQLHTPALENVADEPIFAVERLMMSFCKETLKKELPTSDLPTMSRQILETTHQLLTNQCLVIFVDEVFEENWDFLELFEESLLGPLAIEKKVLILLAGRGRKFPWATPELRFHADFINLDSFDSSTTADQIKKICEPQSSPPVQAIFAFSNGIPLLTYHATTKPNLLIAPQPADVSAILNDFLRQTSDSTRTATIRGYLLALCILNVFDDERIELMVDIYRKDHPQELRQIVNTSDIDTLIIRRELVHESLVHFDNNEGAYVMDRQVRKLAQLFLLVSPQHKATWRKLHMAAIELYQGWCKAYQHTQDKWAAQVTYHQQELQLIND